MAMLLKGAPVAAALNRQTATLVSTLKQRGVIPVLAIVRVGAKADDISYERGAMKRAKEVGIAVRHTVLPGDVSQRTLIAHLDALSKDPHIHGILLFRPLPKPLNEAEALKHIAPEKDVDGCTPLSLAGVMMNAPIGFAPCTAQAVTEIADHYNIDLSGKRVAVIGRSLVIGRPVALLLMHKNATVTVCHTKTKDVPAVTREAEAVVCCSGQTDSLGEVYFSQGQTVIDVGIGWSEEKQKLTGDVRFDEAEPTVAAITPVPGGVGAVTTSVLMGHVALAAERISCGKEPVHP